MSDWPTPTLPPFRVIHSHSEEALGFQLLSAIGGLAPSSQTMSQNLIHYVPFRIDVASTAVKMYYVVGSTSNGNVDMGLYDYEWNYLISSGSTAQGSTATLQELDITDTLLLPGRYWMAIVSNSTTATFYGSGVVDELAFPALPAYTQASTFPLPTSTATVAKTTASTPVIPFIGVSFDTLI